MFFSPLEQFKVVVLFPFHLSWFDISFTNSVVYLLLAFLFIYLVFEVNMRKARLIPDGLQRLGEVLYMFVNNLVKDQAGVRALSYFPLLLLLFVLILFLNLLGLTPFAFTCTSQMCYTFTLGFSMFIGIVIIGLTRLRWDFYKLFVPDITGPLLPFLVLIEIFSFCIRPVSLSLRLFANMLAGHTLLHILSGFILTALKVDILLGLFLFLPVIAVSMLEFGIAFLQAYVFLVLVCIYLNEMYSGGH